MDDLRERFLRIYANVPLKLRDEIILVIEIGGIKKPITWDVAFIEVKANTELSEKILKELERIQVI